MKNGVQIGPDPNHFFIGDPHVDEGSFGCYAQAIVEAIGRAKKLYPEFAYQPVDLTGLATETLTEKYVAAGIPVIYWATMDMEPSGYYGSWALEESGEQTAEEVQACIDTLIRKESIQREVQGRSGQDS